MLYLGINQFVSKFQMLYLAASEFRKIWKRRLSFLNILFIINRYTTCFGYIPIIHFLLRSPANASECNAYVRYPAVLSIIAQVIMTIIVTLRCYALYNRSRWILAPMSGLGLVVLAAFVGASTKSVGIDLNVPGYRTCPDLEFRSKSTDPLSSA